MTNDLKREVDSGDPYRMSTPLKDRFPVARSAPCVLHIGTPKTGSTALQYFLSRNRDQLASAGVVYPASVERGHAQHDLAFLTGGGYPEWATTQPASLDELIERTRIELDGQPTESRLILSSENFYWLSEPSRARNMLASLGYRPEQVAVVVYLRRQDEAVESWYNQLIKALGYSASFEQSIVDYGELWDYEAQIARWAAAFGSASIVPRIYCSEGGSFDVRRDFVSVLGLATSGLDFATAQPNLRLVRDLLEFQRVINRLPLPTPDKRRYHKQLIRLSSDAPALGLDDAPLHTTATRQAVHERYTAGNRAVAHRYFGADELFTPMTGAVDGATPLLTAEKLATVFAWLMMTHTSSPGSSQ